MTPEEARAIANCKNSVKNTLKNIFEGVEKAAINGQYTYFFELSEIEDKAIVSVLIKDLLDSGYKVKREIFYETKQQEFSSPIKIQKPFLIISWDE